MLRLYTKGESEEGVVDVSPRLGRAVLFKSEEMLHKVMSLNGRDNYALTVYFNQIVDKPQKPIPIPDNWKIFIGIASYRDNQLIHTIKSLIEEATYPERLRIVVYNQIDFFHEFDRHLLAELNDYIWEVENGPNPPSFLIENIWSEKSK